MSEQQKKEPQTQLLAPNRPLIITVLVCALAIVVLFMWSRSPDDSSRDISDITRPPQGFDVPDEEFVIVADTPSDQEIDRLEGDLPHATTVADKPNSTVLLQEIAALKDQEKLLQQALLERDALISDLKKQLQAPPVVDNSAPIPVPEKTIPEARPRTHVVKKGETLTEIARQYYGSGGRWQKVYEANKEKLNDKNRVRVGTVLVIPE